MEIILQDTSVHARLFLVGHYSACAHFRYNGKVFPDPSPYEVALDYISFRHSETSDHWVLNRAEVPDIFSRCPYTQSTKVTGNERDVLAKWFGVLKEFETVRLPKVSDGSFDCRSGIVMCFNMMGVSYDARKDFKGPVGNRHVFS